MPTLQTGSIKKRSVAFALLVLATILFLVSWRATHSVPVLAAVAAWCLFGILLPSVLLNKKIRSGSIAPPGRRWVAGLWFGMAVYTLALAVFQILTGSSFTDWGLTLLATGSCVFAALMARREYE